MALPILMYELTNDDQYKVTAKANMRTLRNNANYTPGNHSFRLILEIVLTYSF